MTTIDSSNYSSGFKGLFQNFGIACGIAVSSTIVHDLLSRKRNVSKSQASDILERQRKAPCTYNSERMEEYSMGYLYKARCFVPIRPAEPYSKYPLSWIYQAMFLPETYFLERIGLDAAAYVRFLRACLYCSFVLTVTVSTVLLPIHFTHSPKTLDNDSISRASLSTLVQTEAGHKLLYVHVILLWWMSIVYCSFITWTGLGIVQLRRLSIRSLLLSHQSPNHHKHDNDILKLPNSNVEYRGWRYRTIIIVNLPEQFQDEETLHHYFTENLGGDLDITSKEVDKSRTDVHGKKDNNESNNKRGHSAGPALTGSTIKNLVPIVKKLPPSVLQSSSSQQHIINAKSRQAQEPLIDTSAHPDADGESISNNDNFYQGNLANKNVVSRTIVVKKADRLHSLYDKHIECINSLEKAHVTLAKAIIKHVKQKAKKSKHRQRKDEKLHSKESSNTSNDDDNDGPQQLLCNSVSEFLENKSANDTIWDVLENLPAESLDPFQPKKRISALWKFWDRSFVPLIDYELDRFNKINKEIEKLRLQYHSNKSSTVAFVTFNSPELARKARALIRHEKNFGTICYSNIAPEARDINWKRIIVATRKSIFGEILTRIAIWSMTIFWLIPLSLLVGIFSLNNIGKLVPGILKFFENHEQAKAAISNLLPTILVNVIMLLVPTILLQITLRGQNIFTMSKLHHLTMSRYWKFLLINVLIFFCIATTALQVFLSIFRSSHVKFEPLKVTASAFPAASVFYVSWILLVCGAHNFFELVLFGIALINHAIIANVTCPRKRFELAIPRSCNYAYFVPIHVLVCAVMLVFSLLNPVITTFSFGYFCLALVVFKNQFSRVYWRRYYEENGHLIYRRLMRYSLDALVLAQVIIMALMFVVGSEGKGGACIPTIILTVFYKLGLTRWFNAHMKSLQKEEADIVCGVPLKDSMSNKEPGLETDDNEDTDHAGDDEDELNENENTNVNTNDDDNNNNNNSKTSLNEKQSPWTRFKKKLRKTFLIIPKFIQKLLPPIISVRKTYGKLVRADDPFFFNKFKNYFNFTNKKKQKESSASPSNDDKRQSENESENEQDTDTEFWFGANKSVKLHKALVRDDRPDPSQGYDDPNLTCALNYSLWLPRDPTSRLNLDDTVDYYGKLFASSECEHPFIDKVELPIDDSSRPQTVNNDSYSNLDVDMGVGPSMKSALNLNLTPKYNNNSKEYIPLQDLK